MPGAPAPDPPVQRARRAPAPGTGTVWIHQVEEFDDATRVWSWSGQWWASWLGDGHDEVADVRGARDTVLEWAATRPATRWRISCEQAGPDVGWDPVTRRPW